MLTLDDGRRTHRLAPLPGLDDAAPLAGPDAPLWRLAAPGPRAGPAAPLGRGASRAPADLIAQGQPAFALDPGRGELADLPRPQQARPVRRAPPAPPPPPSAIDARRAERRRDD